MAHHFLVTWSIDILDADTKVEAARLALEVMRGINPAETDSASIFEVVQIDVESDAEDVGELIDLSELEG